VPYLPGISAEDLAFSADGQWVVYASYPDGLLWRSRVDGSERLQLTFPPLQAELPRWSHDAKQRCATETEMRDRRNNHQMGEKVADGTTTLFIHN
jgi:Tol biopolymer transport system component